MFVTNNLGQCQGFTGSQRVVSVGCADNDYAIFQTNAISYCVGIGIIVKSNDNLVKQISLHHSISEHGFNEDSKILLNEYNQMLSVDRNIVLKAGSDESYYNDGRYFACSFVEMLNSTNDDDNVSVMLQIGDNYEISLILDDLEPWFKAYQEIRNIKLNVNITQVDNPDHVGYFAIDSNAKVYINHEDYNNALLMPKAKACIENINDLIKDKEAIKEIVPSKVLLIDEMLTGACEELQEAIISKDTASLSSALENYDNTFKQLLNLLDNKENQQEAPYPFHNSELEVSQKNSQLNSSSF
ncbi:MAG: hypothetical protein EP298_02735 [Gammaproteobacteria bacterium]|nr:MAG: hypothetical protein EP298_02735 [Gammaproteobacteria bacterium]UTW43398.1 hypothetical protein KFE69_04700 [bacterium SCSIO 12844]